MVLLFSLSLRQFWLKTLGWTFALCAFSTKRGLSKKLRHIWHGPMRIYKLSPVTYKVKLPTNSPIATTIHINHMKPYYDPASRPISPPVEDDPSEPYLDESGLPDDSFDLSCHLQLRIAPRCLWVVLCLSLTKFPLFFSFKEPSNFKVAA